MKRSNVVFAMVIAFATAVVSSDSSNTFAAELGHVQGTVMLDGKPLAGAKVFFHLSGDQFVGAKSNRIGKFKVDRIPEGVHKVTIVLLRKGRSALPPKYSDESKTVLKQIIQKGLNLSEFKLKS